MRGISQYASLHCSWTFYHNKFFYLDKSFSIKARKAEYEHLKKWGADGIIAREFTAKMRQEVMELGLPTVISTVFNKEIEESIGNIFVDNYGIGKMAARHFLDRGFRHFAFCGLDEFFWSHDRLKGFSDQVTKYGYGVQVYRQTKNKNKRYWDIEEKNLANWLSILPKPIGLMACIDEHAQDVIETCKQINLHVPEELAIVGGDDDILICELMNPQLSSVAINSVQAGYEAARMLDVLMSGRNPKDNVVVVKPTHVVTRQSTDILAVPDQEVAMSLKFIRDNVRNMIQVQDVADNAMMSRQGLNKKFKHLLGRSVSTEIKRTKNQHIIRLLIETSMSLSEIAQSVGFFEHKTFSQYFKREMGLSPSQYRKKYKGDN